MPCWFYDKEALLNTPSIQDGIDHQTECQYRKEGAQLIIQTGSQMELGYNTLATGIVYFHRFYMFHSFKTFSPYVTACCCLFLAGKAEETPKKSKDIIKMAKTFLSEDKLLILGEDPREEVMTIEKILLQTMRFDLRVRHPYQYLVKYAKCLKGDKRKLQKMVQMAWTFINDSLCTTLSIQWEPEIIAIAVMYLARKLIRFNVISWSHRKPSHTYWWELFVEDLSVEVVEDICHQVLDLYSPLGRYYVADPPQTTEVNPKVSLVDQLHQSSVVSANTTISPRNPQLEISTSTVMTIPRISPKDPRLESRSVFANSHSKVNSPNTSVLSSLVSLSANMKSPATPTAPPPLHDDSHLSASTFIVKPNVSMTIEHEAQEYSEVTPYFPRSNPSTFPSPMDCFTSAEQSTVKKDCDNIGSFQPKENQDCDRANDKNSDDNNKNHLLISKGFGVAESNNDNCNENRFVGNRGFGNYGNYRNFRNNHDDHDKNNIMKHRAFIHNNYGNADDYGENHPTIQGGFGNSTYNSDSYIENRPMGTRGFGNMNNSNNKYNEISNRGFGNMNSDNNSRLNENQFRGNRGFGNASNNNNHSYHNRQIGNRGFRRRNNNGRYNENKPLGNRGFGNANSFSNNCNANDSTPRLRFNRGNRFQQPYPRKFNNNYENDRYSQNDTNSDNSTSFKHDAPGKIVDKQRFYHLPDQSGNNDEESWD